MTYLADRVGQVLLAAVLQDELARDDGAFELEGHLGGGEVLVCGADVVEEAGEVVRLWVVVPLGEVRSDKGGT